MNVIDYYDFTHELDRKALKSLQSIPGFTKLLKAYMRAFSDRQNHLMNMSSKVLLGPNQLPQLYNLLPPICERLGIATPPLYLEYDPVANAYTRGDNFPDITITTGLVEHMTEEEIQIVLAHECGHILCRHVLYQTMGSIILSGGAAILNLPGLGTALDLAFMYWMRCSEFSADRTAAVFCGDARKVAQIMFRLAGCPKELESEANLDYFMSQAAHFDEYMKDSTWNKFLGYGQYAYASHPLTAVRASEVVKWGSTQDFQIIVENLNSGVWRVSVPTAPQPSATPVSTAMCPQCGKPVAPGSAFCGSCGSPVPALPVIQNQFCAQCGTPLQPNAAFCPGCGQPQMAQPQQFAPAPQTSTDKIRNNMQSAMSGMNPQGS